MGKGTTILLVGFLPFLSGCATVKSWFSKGDTPIVQPAAPTSPSVVDKLGLSLDKSDGKVAAAITVAQANADKPAVVKAETAVALSYLPKPSKDDLSVAEARVIKSDPQTYALAEADGRRLLAAVNAQWDLLEKQQAEAKKASDAKDARITSLTAKVAQIEAEANRSPFVWASGLSLLAAIGLVVAGQYQRAALLVALGGVLASIATVLSNPAFIWLLIATGTALIALAVWFVWDKVRDAVNAKPQAKEIDAK